MERTHAAPRTAVVWAVLRAELERRAGENLTIVDVGGGTGGFAVPLAQAGHTVTVVDANPDALAALARRAAEAGVGERVTAVQGDADRLGELVPTAGADLVLCHSVLEVVDDPAVVAGDLAGALRSGGAASIVVANRVAAALARAIAGQLPAALATFQDPAGRGGPRDTLLRRYDAESASALLASAGLAVEQVHGVRVAADLVPGALLDTEPGAYEALLRFELAAAAVPPYRDIATQIHLLARKS
ncbi:methyltransferase [Longispora fulva]|uniref:SAM-dependent methyltransferase n=1 Tax=Longispora fulva TaxID=619741 RepID=A0A8J7GXU8_9ACTN|nr:methyltransferase domain-containing protein [Longispora fulva]MBG6141164.1 SAM-dependent methyltransferase [Longispora fulva]GIG62841.1 methyltransferase [Longispora fulva]